MTEFYIRLKEIRRHRKKTLKETADRLGIQLRSYQAYESGDREPNIARLIVLADFFDVSLDYLLGRTDTDPNL
ncbi:helix-turn-helix domain-containing protein [Intestinimonas butyriciproducens]|uniref:helix-turn-helix domain-containing protein n=1 Tax=Intestinimonas butyriciproducens TaxID=1297617 RepID=UPI0019573ABE